MKTKMFLVIAILWSQVVFSQVKSCVEFDPNRTLDGFKKAILNSTDPFIREQLWPAYSELVNNILSSSKIDKVRNLKAKPDSIWISWIMDHTQEYENSYFLQSDYLNGVRIGNTLDYRDVAGALSSWAVFSYEDVSGMYAKVKCCNPEKTKKNILGSTSTTSTQGKTDTIIVKVVVEGSSSPKKEKKEKNASAGYYANGGFYAQGSYKSNDCNCNCNQNRNNDCNCNNNCNNNCDQDYQYRIYQHNHWVVVSYPVYLGWHGRRDVFRPVYPYRPTYPYRPKYPYRTCQSYNGGSPAPSPGHPANTGGPKGVPGHRVNPGGPGGAPGFGAGGPTGAGGYRK